MELHDFNNLLQKVKNEGEMFEFTNGDDLASVHFIKQTERFLFMFNGVGMFDFKSLRHFRDKLMYWVETKNLELVDESSPQIFG